MIYLQFGGDPIAWKRAGINKHSGNFYDRQHTEKEQYRWQMRNQYKGQPLGCSLKAKAIYKLPIPAGTSKVRRSQMLAGLIRPNKKPDVDNLQKFIFDAMTGVIYKDDCQICESVEVKLYSDVPGVDVYITPILEPEEVIKKIRAKKAVKINFPTNSEQDNEDIKRKP
jgi:Holliday junction resolvase RusA-like endonuclease